MKLKEEVFEGLTIDDIDRVARRLVELSKEFSCLCFYGQLGAGKTTLIKRICVLLGVNEMVTSPTFSIINEYICEDNSIIFHFDCYRLENEIEALDLGIEEYLDSGNLCLIEWPQKIDDLLPNERVTIEIFPEGDLKRTFFIKYEY